jgi:hypothetical protein
MIDCRCEPHASGSNRCVLCKAEAQASARAETLARTAASSLGIPAEPPPGHVPAPSYAPRVKTDADRIDALERLVEDLQRQLSSLRGQLGMSRPMHSPEPYYRRDQ